MSLSRRRFLQVSGAALCVGALPGEACAANHENPLPIPPLLESRRGQPIFLTLQKSHWSFTGRGNKAPVWGVNGLYLGPTVRVWRGDDIKLIYSNRLSEAVAMNVSGLQVPGAVSGGAARVMPAGGDWAPVLPIRQAASTCWYHANTSGKMGSHVYNGLAGMWLVEDDDSKKLLLPNHYGVDDFPLIIQDKRLNSFGVAEYNPPEEGGFYGDRLLVNGVENPYVEVSRGWVRLRLLNASNARRYQLQISDGRPFYVIASDQGFLSAPVMVSRLSLAPGERREVVIDMSKGDEVSVNAGKAANLFDRLRGIFESSGQLSSTQVLTLRPTGMLPLVTETTPPLLQSDFMPEGNAIRTREFILGSRDPGINGALWEINRIDVMAKQGTFERWIVRADLPQSFHIQGVMFMVKSVNGASAMMEDRGWKDTVWVDGYVELLVFMAQSAAEMFPFLYYSQTLEMADRGSAAQLQVQPAN
ncbi:MAG: Cell division protein FtsP [Candidatus Erwinia impunctatus]|nr:Cell division protein FtsP [Culicoides impunctatus]